MKPICLIIITSSRVGCHAVHPNLDNGGDIFTPQNRVLHENVHHRDL